MKVSFKVFVLAGLLAGMLSTPLFADEKKGNGGEVKSKVEESASDSMAADEDFCFPEYEASMESYWGKIKPMHNSCSAQSWFGATASATCPKSQNCICNAYIVTVECHCENVASSIWSSIGR